MTCKIPNCVKPAKKRGWCEMHYCRWRSTGDPLKTKIGGWDETASEKLQRRSQPAASGCIEWTGACDEDGYGKFTKKGWPDRAHKAAYIVAHGDIPEGQIVRHTCDNPPCINPQHLVAGTFADNAADRVQRERFNRESNRFNRVRLSMDLAREIRVKHSQGVSRCALAAEYGVGADQISRVIHHNNWKETA
jgi:hypothetical protein